MKSVDSLPCRVRLIEHLWIALPDGCRLAARLWLPEGADELPVPAILEYHPYRKRDGTSERDEQNHGYFAGHGYASIRVDLRGSGESDGTLSDEYTAQELADADAVIAWIAQQPWCDGGVAMFGLSWGGFNGLQIAARRPPALRAVATAGSTDDRYADDCHYKGGCLLSEHAGWAATLLSFLTRPPDPALYGRGWRKAWLARLNAIENPLSTWLRHQRRDAFWRHGSVCEDIGAIEVPVLIAGGWNDAWCDGALSLLRSLESPRKAIIGPWMHRFPHMGIPGPQIGYLQECLRWFDRWMKQIDNGIEAEPDLRFFMQEAAPPSSTPGQAPGRWCAEKTWPSPSIKQRRYRMTAEGRLTAGRGGRRTSKAALSICSPQSVGLAGGEFAPMGWGSEAPSDQRNDDGGSLVFETEPLSQRLEILGAPVLELEIASDKPVAFIAARLCAVGPKGKSARVCYGVLNLTHRDSHAKPSRLKPEKAYAVRLALDSVAYAFPAGHRIRIALSTAYWPVVWPAPEAATLSLKPESSGLTLPLRPSRRERAPVFKPAEAAVKGPRKVLVPGSNYRESRIDHQSGETIYEVVDDTGRTLIVEPGLEIGNRTHRIYRIHPDDPTSAAMESHRTQILCRAPNWNIRTETRSRQSCDKKFFYISSQIEVFKNDRLVFSEDWDDKIKRDLV